MKHTIIDIQKSLMKNKTVAELEYAQGTCLFYSVIVEDRKYTFPIDISDKKEVGDTVFNLKEQGSLLVRYIKIADKSDKVREELILDKGDNL